MNPITKLVDKFINRPKMGANYIGAPSFREVNPYGFFDFCDSDAYASAYPSIRAISNEYMTIRPFAIDSNGKQVQNNQVINALYHPNQKDSSVSFFEKIAVSTLVLPNTYILVWRDENRQAMPGGDFKGKKGSNIAGFTFLEGVTLSIRDNKTYYSLGSQEFTQNEVIVLPGGVNPYNLYAGYSPTIAAKKWATLDDYIADFQKGFFENNAIPAGHFIITAASEQDYKDTVQRMKKKHQGAGKNNNVTYTPRPLGSDGKPADSKIEWIPFAQSNKDIGFKELFEQANKRLDLSFGVPQIVKGVDDAATYANAQVAEKTFAQRAVYPLALRNYTQFTHELNRITGGLGVAITFDYHIPTVADEEKVNAETKNIESRIINTMVTAGYTLDSIIDAFELPTSYKLLTSGMSKETTINNDKPDVDEGNEVDDSPDQTKVDGVTPLKKGEANRKNPKAKLSDREKLEKISQDYLESQVNRAVSEYREQTQDKVKMEIQADPTTAEIDTFITAAMGVIVPILVSNGESEYAAGVVIAGLSMDDLQGFMLPEEAEDAYRTYLRRVGTSYGSDTANSIRKVLSDSEEKGLNRRETEKALKDILDTDDYRVKRLARTELNNSQNIGKLEGIKNLSAETGTEWEKTINHSGKTPCPLCQSQEGIWRPIATPLWAEGTVLVAPDEQGNEVVYVNDWQTNEASDYHANGTGALVFRRAQ